ncbi:MAG: hypothetical protein BGO78_11725 [Chloroflexi bacterium 44-23]|nr:MAG: hypothetical protein BGO78_11725 [Chloroflexi bacterium 44-23]
MAAPFSLSRLMGKASAVSLFLQDGMVSRMLCPHERFQPKESSYPWEGKHLAILFLKSVRNTPLL